MKKISISFVFLFLFFVILNPYTFFGPISYYFMIPFFLYVILTWYNFFDTKIIFIVFLMIFISLIGVFSSYLHGIPQYEHLKVSVSLFVYLVVGFGLYFFSVNRGIEFNKIIFMILISILLNSIIILFEVSYPNFRIFIESFLVEAGNRDWSDGFRYRGMAASGGASLSLLHAVGVALLLYLLGEKKISILTSIVSLSILFFSMFFIGRTGLIFALLAILIYVIFSKKNFLLFVFLVLSFVVSSLFYDKLVNYLIDTYGEGFYNYSLGFLVEGREGIKNEGTVDTLSEFIKVLPVTFPEVLIGYGFYGGSHFEPWTDSGYSRMFLSVGYLFGVLYYLCFVLILSKVFLYKKNLFLIIIPLLLLAEVKEVLLFSGYSSRLLFIILGFLIMEKKYNVKNKFNI